jgi:uncharacterized protein (TIGR03000 family)
MNRPSWKSVLFVLVIVAAVFAATDQASAWWGCCRPSCYGGCGWSGCYSPCYSCWDSCSGCDGWYVGCRPGPVRRLLLGRYRWYYGGCGCYGGCGYGGCGGCYGGCGYGDCGTYSVGCCGATVEGTTSVPAGQQPAPTPAQTQKPVMEAPRPTPMPPLEMPKETPSVTPPPPAGTAPPAEPAIPGMPGGEPKSSYNPTPENSGVITVWVPYDAKVTVNGRVTKSAGSRRQFVSYGLQPGLSYKYEIHAEVARNGQLVEENRTVVLTMGQDTAVVFGLNTQPVENLASVQQ